MIAEAIPSNALALAMARSRSLDDREIRDPPDANRYSWTFACTTFGLVRLARETPHMIQLYGDHGWRASHGQRHITTAAHRSRHVSLGITPRYDRSTTAHRAPKALPAEIKCGNC